jgi:hypothetical protein
MKYDKFALHWIYSTYPYIKPVTVDQQLKRSRMINWIVLPLNGYFKYHNLNYKINI